MLGQKTTSLIYKISTFILIIGSVYFFFTISYDYYTLINSPYQQEYRETVTSLATQLLLDNENPYKIENQPEYAQAYGITQNIIAYPFAYFFGSSLQVHRIVTLIGIILSCITLFSWLIKLKTPLLIAFSATLTLYISFFYNVLPINRPDSWGLFFMLSSIYIPFCYNYSIKSFIISILLGLLAFYTKSYFILGVVSTGSFIFFFISMKKGLIYTGFFLLLFTLSVYIVSYIYPLFFYLTVLSFLNYATEGSWLYANKQVITFAYVNKFLLFLAIITLFYFLYLVSTKKIKLDYKININFTNFDKELITTKLFSSSSLLIIYTLFILFIIVHIVLGRNKGAFLIYYFTHTTPFFILAVVIFAFKFKSKLIESVVMIFIVLNMWSVSKLLYSSSLTEEQEKNWQTAKNYIKSDSHVIGSPIIANLIKEKGLKVYEQGLSKQFVFAADIKKPILKNIFPRYKEIKTVSENFYTKIDSNIINKSFDLIVTESNVDMISTKETISTYYVKIDTLILAMPFTGQEWKLEFWKPKK